MKPVSWWWIAADEHFPQEGVQTTGVEEARKNLKRRASSDADAAAPQRKKEASAQFPPSLNDVLKIRNALKPAARYAHVLIFLQAQKKKLMIFALAGERPAVSPTPIKPYTMILRRRF